jgi:hypothetical protein
MEAIQGRADSGAFPAVRTWFSWPSISMNRCANLILFFGIQYRIGSDPTLHDVFNFLTFKALREKAEPENPDPDDGKRAGKKPKAPKTAQIENGGKGRRDGSAGFGTAEASGLFL